MQRLSDMFVEAAASCKGLSQLWTLLSDISRELGFSHFALLDHASLSARASGLIRLDNYPDDWVRELVAKGFAADDPVHLASLRSNRGFGWCELGSLIRLERRHKTILARSRYYGIGGGFTVPANVLGEPSASCSFAVPPDCEVPLERLDCVERIGAHALSAARRLRPLPPAPQRPRLSPRELQCLRLVAIGKSDWEIAKILRVSFVTARQYVTRARAAYDCVSRTQLVVYGLRDHWITFEESIPPTE